MPGFACGEREVEFPAVGMATADAHALIGRTLRRKGRPIPSNALWIAASCLEHGAVLIRLDTYFDQVDGVRRIRCWAEALP